MWGGGGVACGGEGGVCRFQYSGRWQGAEKGEVPEGSMRREGAAACSRAEGARSACDSACARDGAGDACRLGEGRGACGSRRSGGRGSAARCAAARGEGSAEATTRFERRALLLQKEVSELLEAGALLAADLTAAAVELKTKVKLDSAQINNCQLMFSLLFFSGDITGNCDITGNGDITGFGDIWAEKA